MFTSMGDFIIHPVLPSDGQLSCSVTSYVRTYVRTYIRTYERNTHRHTYIHIYLARVLHTCIRRFGVQITPSGQNVLVGDVLEDEVWGRACQSGDAANVGSVGDRQR